MREFTSEDERRITIVLDTRLPAGSGEELKQRFERGVIQAASLLKHFIDERAEVRLGLGEEVGPFGSGAEHLYLCLRRLALVTALRDGETGAKETSTRDVVGPDYAILLTAAAPGSIPANVWRTSHVIYL